MLLFVACLLHLVLIGENSCHILYSFYDHFPGPRAVFVFKISCPTIAWNSFFPEREISIYDWLQDWNSAYRVKTLLTVSVTMWGLHIVKRMKYLLITRQYLQNHWKRLRNKTMCNVKTNPKLWGEKKILQLKWASTVLGLDLLCAHYDGWLLPKEGEGRTQGRGLGPNPDEIQEINWTSNSEVHI